MRIRELEWPRQGELGDRIVDEVVYLHRQYGLRLAFSRENCTVALNGKAAELVTELLRLAALGASVQFAAKDLNSKMSVQDAYAAAEAAWQERIR